LSILLLAGCSPVVFSGSTAKVILGPAPPPVEEESSVQVTDDKLVINDKIHFEYNSDVIKQESFGLLAEIAKVITEHPEITRIRIEGHASSEGSDSYNMDLSRRRAASVLKHLVDKGGIEEGRLISEGFGETQPIASNDDEVGREKNRRVEFMILERSQPSESESKEG
jgi:OOP family OmpA-OmpF porin